MPANANVSVISHSVKQAGGGRAVHHARALINSDQSIIRSFQFYLLSFDCMWGEGGVG